MIHRITRTPHFPIPSHTRQYQISRQLIQRPVWQLRNRGTLNKCLNPTSIGSATKYPSQDSKFPSIFPHNFSAAKHRQIDKERELWVDIKIRRFYLRSDQKKKGSIKIERIRRVEREIRGGESRERKQGFSVCLRRSGSRLSVCV